MRIPPSQASTSRSPAPSSIARAIDLYRLAWDLSEIAIYVSDFHRPHDRTDDTEEAWTNLQHFLDPTRWRS